MASVAAICLIAMGTWHQGEAPMPRTPLTPQSVLESLVQYDSVFKSGFTAEATQRRMDRIDFLGPFYRVEARWKLTGEGSRIGYDMEVVDFETPSYLPPDQRRWAAGGKAPETDEMVIAVKNREWGYWGEKESGTLELDLTLKVLPNGTATRGNTIANAYLYGTQDITPIAYRESFRWALGRFFSDRIDKIESVESVPGNRVKVAALGSLYPGNVGRFELEIEPSAAWMVRAARFYPATEPTRIAAEMTNQGAHWSGPFCIPQTARVNFFGPLEDASQVPGTYTRELEFARRVDRFNEEFFEECRRSVLQNTQPDLLVTDARVVPPQYVQPNRPAPEPTRSTPSGRGWLIVANVAAVLGMLLIWLVRRGAVRRTTEERETKS